ncbi:MAG: archease [Sulfolobales archaeon]|nr:archease [Sulfolobales archaeon]MCX8208892.1 archease [Sulfolobales archaeon]MDW8011026.1 archease [Sulfolobales archaeon]
MSNAPNCNYFKFLEHTADVYVEVCGESLEKAFELAGVALFEVMTDTSKVEPRISRVIEDCGFDLENTLYRWLEDLLIEYGRSNVVFSRINVEYVRKEDRGYVFKAVCLGDYLDLEKYEARTEVKAVTYSLMEIVKLNGKWVLRFVLDI